MNADRSKNVIVARRALIVAISTNAKIDIKTEIVLTKIFILGVNVINTDNVPAIATNGPNAFFAVLI